MSSIRSRIWVQVVIAIISPSFRAISGGQIAAPRPKVK